MTIPLPDPLPRLPPDELIARVMPHFGPDQAEGVRTTWHALGEITLRAQERALAAVGRRLEEFERLLDFGCGPGRTLGLMGALAPAVELHGVDIDRDAIDWAATNLPFARWHVGPQEPPLAFADGHFDLVVNHSLFTHLDARMQDLWLAELRRVVRPGGLVLLSTHGETMAQAMLRDLAGGGEDPAPYELALQEQGILFIEHDGYIGSVHPPYYHSTFHAPWYVYAHWGRFFSVRALLTPGSWGGHDIVVLERTGGDVPTVTPIVPRTAAADRAAPTPSAAGGDAGGPPRHERMLALGLYQLADRLTLVERELRARIEALERSPGGDA